MAKRDQVAVSLDHTEAEKVEIKLEFVVDCSEALEKLAELEKALERVSVGLRSQRKSESMITLTKATRWREARCHRDIEKSRSLGWGTHECRKMDHYVAIRSVTRRSLIWRRIGIENSRTLDTRTRFSDLGGAWYVRQLIEAIGGLNETGWI